jgi:phospholipase/carboxylesterase
MISAHDDDSANRPRAIRSARPASATASKRSANSASRMMVCRTYLVVVSSLVVAEGGGCNSRDTPPMSVTPTQADTPSTAPVVPPPPAGEPGSTTRGEIAGVRYLEHMTGGARPDERVPMIVALHPMDGDPADFLPLLRRYHRRARLILPYGHPSGGMYFWYDSVREDVAAPVVAREADRIAGALAALVAARPTVGKPLVTGFSQGGIMTFALAVTHPEALAAAFPISGLLPPSLYPSAALSSLPRPATLPPIAAFHGDSDLAVPTRGARASIAELQSAGYTAELHEYVGVEHNPSDKEMGEVLERIGRAADSLAAAAPAP